MDPPNVPTTYRQAGGAPKRSKPAQESRLPCLNFLLLGVFVLLVGVTAILVIASRSLPGDRMYPVKRWSEEVRVRFTSIPSERLELEKSYDQERLEEVLALSDQASAAEVDFSAPLSVADSEGVQSGEGIESPEQGGSGLWMVGEIPVIVSSDTQVTGDISLGIYVTVSGRLLPTGEVEARHIQPRVYEITAPLNSVASNQWLVDGVTVAVMPDTLIRGSPAIGAELTVKAHMLFNERMAARYIEVISP